MPAAQQQAALTTTLRCQSTSQSHAGGVAGTVTVQCDAIRATLPGKPLEEGAAAGHHDGGVAAGCRADSAVRATLTVAAGAARSTGTLSISPRVRSFHAPVPCAERRYHPKTYHLYRHMLTRLKTLACVYAEDTRVWRCNRFTGPPCGAVGRPPPRGGCTGEHSASFTT
jgi:hypothetical protein